MTTTSLSIDKDIRDYGEWRISIGSSFSRSESYYTEAVEVDADTQQQMDRIGTLWNHKNTV